MDSKPVIIYKASYTISVNQ